MRTITKKSCPFFVVILGIVFSLSVQGQMVKNFRIFDKNNFESQFLMENQGQSFFINQTNLCKPFHKSIQNSYPQEIHHFYWDVTTIWMADYNKFLTYNPHGNILTEMKVDVNTGDTTERMVNTYDSEERPTEELHQLWVNGDWENDYKDIHVFDDHGNMTISLHQLWQGNNWVSNSGQKYIYIYDINDNIIDMIYQTWDFNSTTWINSSRNIYTFDFNGFLVESVYQVWDSNISTWSSAGKQTYTNNAAGITTEVLFQTWDDVTSNWINELRYINIVWHNWTGEFYGSEYESITVLNWSNGVWVNYYRFNITYEANGSEVQVQEIYFNGNWVNSLRETRSCDDHGNETGYMVEFWNNSAWYIDMAFEMLLTYNGNDVTQCINQTWDHISQLWIYQWKEEYSDFYYTQGIDLNSSNRGELQLFPNPASGFLNVEIRDAGSEILSIEIIDLNGQVVYCRQLNNADSPVLQIDLSNCPSGVYFVKLYGDEVKTGKIILQ